MLIDFHYLVNKYKINFTGILHVGAHECEEIVFYDKYLPRDKVVWIDALPDKVALSKQKFTNILIENAVVSDKVEVVKFHRSNNGQSSSILEMGTHLIHHPEVGYIQEYNVKTTRLDTILVKYPNINCNFVNLDIQGAELKALKGMGDYLHKVDYIYTEINTEYVYKDCALLTELDDYLKTFGFKRKEIKIYGNYGWGDAFYIRENKIPQNISQSSQSSQSPQSQQDITNIISKLNSLNMNSPDLKISLCIPTMNRYDTFLKNTLIEYNKYLDAGLVDEIVIADETGHDYDKIKTQWGDKFKLIKNPKRLGVFKNKINVCKNATYDNILLMDSDNFAPMDYIIKIRFHLTKNKNTLPDNYILSSSLAKTNQNFNFDLSFLKDKKITKQNIIDFLKVKDFGIFLNIGNYLITKNTIVNIKYDESDSSLMKLISACDVMFFNLLALQQYPDLQIHVIRDTFYLHTVHDESTYKTDINKETENYRDNVIMPQYYKLND